MEILLNEKFNTIDNNQLDIINGGGVFGLISGVATSGAGACAIGGGIAAIKAAEAGAIGGPVAAIALGAIGFVGGAVAAYNNL